MTHDRHDTFVPLLTLEPLTKLQGQLAGDLPVGTRVPGGCRSIRPNSAMTPRGFQNRNQPNTDPKRSGGVSWATSKRLSAVAQRLPFSELSAP